MSGSSKNYIKTPEDTPTRSRPRWIRFLIWVFLFFSFYHFLRFSQAIIKLDLLLALPLNVSPQYLAASGLLWGLMGSALTWGLWRGKKWSSSAARVLSSLYGLAFWADRIWIAEPELLAQRWPINVLLTIIGLAAIFIILRQKTSQVYFQKNPAKIP